MTSQASKARVPLAIVGIGCRLPGGVVDANSYWDLLIHGRSGIVEVPPNRWSNERYYHADPSVPGRITTRWGGFVDGIDQFDAKFWGISPREAVRMDPQQRWMLEVSWEALEDAGVPPATLRDSATGVFVGVSSSDYGSMQLQDHANIDVHTNSGGTASIVSNRISYMLDLKGPSMSIDTACSSALTATVLACEQIWLGKCTAALAGGVNALIVPHPSIGFSKASMLSPSGQCFAFDARAEGYVRAEGAGMVLIKPLADALRDGNPIYALIRAAVANQDGHTSSMAVPSVKSQSAMLRQACRDAGIDPREVGYVEAHGTGTPVGDPIEARAIGNVMGEGRDRNESCLVGSVKPNIGHLESASGIAGLIKTALVLNRGVVPPNLNFEMPNPDIPFEALRLEVVQEERTLPRREGRSLAVVNSFGFGGANATLVMESSPRREQRSWVGEHPDRPFLLPLSARDGEALRDYAKAFRARLDDETLADLCWSAATRKEQHPHRAVVIGRDARGMRDAINDFLKNNDRSEQFVVGLRRGEQTPEVSAVFTGQGSQWWGMGQQLIQREPLFRHTIEEIDARLSRLAEWSLIEEMTRDEATSNVDRTDIAQPAIFALQVGLLELWKSWGVSPARVVGHSVGEVAAAYCAGIFSLADAVKVIFQRSRLQERTAGRGGMLALGVSAAEANELIGDDAPYVEVAGFNSPDLVTIAGDTEPLARIEAQLKDRGGFVRRLRVNYAFHSHQMEPIRRELLEALADISPQPSPIPFVSTVTGCVLDGRRLNADYWWRNVRSPVLFAPAVRSMIRGGARLFLELGPHPALQSSVSACMDSEGRRGTVFFSLQRVSDESESLARNLGGLHIAGVRIDWAAYNRSAGNPQPLPRYPWQHEGLWLDRSEMAKRQLSDCHPLLGVRVTSTTPTWEFSLDPRVHTYLADHRLLDSIVFPGAGYAEMGLAVARELFPETRHVVEDLEIQKALFVDPEQPPRVRVVFQTDEKVYSVFSEPEDQQAEWELHACGRLVAMDDTKRECLDLSALKSRLPDHAGHEAFYGRFAEIGFEFGPNFKHIQNSWRENGEALCEVEVTESVRQGLSEHLFHPALMDAGFQASWATVEIEAAARPEDLFYLPSAVRRIRVYTERMPARVWMYASRRAHDGKTFSCDIAVVDEEGRRLAEILGFEATRMDRSGGEPWADCLYEAHWEPRRLRGSRLQGPSPLAPGATVVDAVRSVLPEVYEKYEVGAYYEEFKPDVDRIVAQLLENAMLELGWRFHAGERIDLETFIDRLRVADQHRRLAGAELRWLATVGVLEAENSHWVVRRAPQRKSMDHEFERLLTRYPALAPDTELVREVIPQLAAVLSGNIDPLELLFPGGTSERLARFYAQGQGIRALNTLLVQAVRSSLAGLPPRRDVRILEVGGGTGSLTDRIVEALPIGRCEYVFTDVGPAFVESMRTKFRAAHPYMEFRTFDVEKPPRDQNVWPGSFDVVVASNVLHATRDVRVTLDNLKSCLAPGGMLLFLEVVRQSAKLDNIFGLLEGWWRFEDDLRTTSPLLTSSQWAAVLEDRGFEDVQSFGWTAEGIESEQAAFLAFHPKATAVAEAATERGSDGERCELESVVLLCDEGGVGRATATALPPQTRIVTARLGKEFRRLGTNGYTVRADSADDLKRLLDDAQPVARVVHLCSLDHPDVEDLDAESLKAAQRTGVLSALALVKAIASMDADEAPPRAYFVTRQAQRVADGDDVARIASSPLVGLVRTANNEHPNCRWTIVDLDAPSPFEAADLADELLMGDDELETAYRSGRRHVRRVTRSRMSELPKRRAEAVGIAGDVVPYRLETDKPGVLANLALHETPRLEPGPSQVEVRVMAGGINFRDVMKALGIYPGNPADLLWFGDDFAGVVTRVGESVMDIKPGDEVAGMSPNCFRSFAIADRRLLFRKPPDLSFEEAATLPTAFLTAHYSLVHLAHMQPAERILIHAATGGVGQAAIQIAQHLNLEIFATAGTDEKRKLLRDSGVEHVMNSRTLDFADEIMEITGGEGVDAVLNSLAGEFIPKSLSVLAPFGRFLEIGKVDIYSNRRIGLKQLKDNISYLVIDLAQHLERDPELTAGIFSELAERFGAGQYRPLTYKAFPVDRVIDAFRYMAQGKHIGKNVLSFRKPSIPIGPCTQDGHRFRGDATYLITGGAGGFGLEVAKWMVRQGARHLALVSRSGPQGEAVEFIERLRSDGVEVADLRVDVTQWEAVRGAIDAVQNTMPPLRGVVHGAMVLDDEFLVELDEARFNAVLEPKMLGAWNLHKATERQPLEHFICFSSYSSVLGGPRQSNYNAGNVFLASLAQHRRSRGLSALTVDWGALLGAGFVERNQRTAKYLNMVGVRPFYVSEALDVLGELLLRDPIQVAAGRLDWPVIGRFSPVVHNSPTFAGFLGGEEQGGGPLRPRLLAASLVERIPLVEDFVTEQVASVFGIEASDVDRDASLSDLGLDSLMAVELMNRVESALGMKIPMGKALSGPSVRELSRTLLELLGEGAKGTTDSMVVETSSGLPALGDTSPRRIPLSDRQRIEWLDPARVQGAALRLPTAPVSALEVAVAALPRRHPMLAARIVQHDGAPHLDLAAGLGLSLEARECRCSDERVSELVATEAMRPLSSDGPLVRVTLLKNVGGDDAILLAAHGVVADRWSSALILQDLVGEALGGVCTETGHHYPQLMEWEQCFADSDQFNPSIQYWREALAGAPMALSLGMLTTLEDGSSQGLPGEQWAAHPFELESDLWLRTLVAAAERDVSPQAMLQTALSSALHIVSGQPDLLVAASFAGRMHEELRVASGPFARPLPVRSKIRDEDTLGQLLRWIDDSLRRGGESQQVPSSRLSSELGLAQPIETIAPVSLSILGADALQPSLLCALAAGRDGAEARVAGQWIRSVDLPPTRPLSGAVSLAVSQWDGELRGWWQHRPSVCSRAAIVRLDELVRGLLERLVAEPATRVWRAAWVTAEEKRRRDEGVVGSRQLVPGEPVIDFDLETQLDEEIAPREVSAARAPGPKRVLLTGATGFLGAFLVGELLGRTDAEITCLVRADDTAHGAQRITDNLAKYQLDPPARDRVSVVVGNLGQPRLGLEPDVWEELVDQTDEIYHNGAVVNLALPYRALRSNVTATREILRLASEGHAKRLHYVSTFTVLSTNVSRGRTVKESDPLPDCATLLHGYAQTKWVSESLVKEAARRGLPTTIYRPGHITGSSRSGASNTTDLLHTIMLSSTRLGVVPIRESEFDLTPVDYVAKALVAISLQQDSIGGTYHLTNPNPLKHATFVEWMVKSGMDVELVPYADWREQFVEFCSEDPTLQVIAGFVAPRILETDQRDGYAEAMHPVFDTSRTEEALEGTGIVCPPVNEELLTTYLNYLRPLVPDQIVMAK